MKKWLPFELTRAVYFVPQYPNLLALYVQYTKTLAIKKWLLFELICPLYLELIEAIHFVSPYPNLLNFYVQYTKTKAVKKWLPFELMCSVLRVHSNHSLCLFIPIFTDIICSVHKDTSPQKVASIWAYMFIILKVHSNHSLWLSIPKFTELICSVVYILNWLYMLSTPRIKPSKSGFHLSLYVQHTYST